MGFKGVKTIIIVLVNTRTGKPIVERVEVADTFWKRGIGLMFKKSFDGALVFPNVGTTSFHGFFCFFPILLVCLDGDNRVVELKRLDPWQVVPVNCKTVIELDARRKYDIKPGDELIWNED